MMALGVNVCAQMVSKLEEDNRSFYSLSSNPDLTIDIFAQVRAREAEGIPAAIVLFSLPLLGIRARVRDAKRHELEVLDHAILSADRALEPDRLAHLNALLERRDRIVSAREWPIDMTTYRRVALYVVIPPLAWVGAALVEIVLASALG